MSFEVICHKKRKSLKQAVLHMKQLVSSSWLISFLSIDVATRLYLNKVLGDAMTSSLLTPWKKVFRHNDAGAVKGLEKVSGSLT